MLGGSPSGHLVCFWKLLRWVHSPRPLEDYSKQTQLSLWKSWYYRKRGDQRLSCKNDTGCCLLQLGGYQYKYLKVSESIWTEFFLGKDYSGAKFLYTEPISLKKAHSMKWKPFSNKTLHLYNHFFKITKYLSFRRVRHTTMNNRVPSTFVSISAQRK